ncbi:dipeptidase PepV [Halobacillus andaensis]|uniref:Dipeptidase PepV n=1 Tax=Halobacillus andaensis TaxID=1176239 RepID=A0A917AZN1_HALAA|nr:dipeptidase PepV [Halobacillus andaensis]MBP2002793.1 succinyl-diaminopimelate desuccinylase [Halobacillus andaensis]GGF05757.1 dipeptidase PepV [Halobacillus andaensis]
MDFSQLAESYQDQFVNKLFPLLKIPSIYKKSDQYLYGKSIDEALNYMLSMAAKDGFVSKNVNGHAGHIEFGQGEKLIGILGHLDVVPAGEGWKSDPFQPVLEQGNIYARGAQDDKGPVVAAYIAMKLLKDEGFVPNKRVRLIMGTDEERDWQGIHYYFTKEEMPEFGFTPDASFPVIHAEKGLIDAYVTFSVPEVKGHALLSFFSGDRLNMVPEQATATLNYHENIEPYFQSYLNHQQLKGSLEKKDNTYVITMFGQTAHGSTPEAGVNAALQLLGFLNSLQLETPHQTIVEHLLHSLSPSDGNGFDGRFKDAVSGELTCNTGSVKWSMGAECQVGLNIRYPVSLNYEKIVASLERFAGKGQGTLNIYDHLKALHVEKDHPYVQTLLKIYNQKANDTAVPQAIGGATYARALQSGVAYGALFKDSPDTAHQPNEHIRVADMVKAIAIYAEAIYQLSK